MKLEEIIPHLREGKKVRIKHWPKEDYVIMEQQGTLVLICPDSQVIWNKDFGYYLDSVDWEVVPEPEVPVEPKVRFRAQIQDHRISGGWYSTDFYDSYDEAVKAGMIELRAWGTEGFSFTIEKVYFLP